MGRVLRGKILPWGGGGAVGVGARNEVNGSSVMR
jgi:hypothetical protein